MFELEPQIQGATLTLLLKGDVLFKDVVEFNKVMREYSKKPNISNLVLDLGLAGNMDVSGLGVIVSLNTSMQRYGRRLVLLHPAPHFLELLKNAEIEGFFPTCESIEELKGFIPEAQRKAKDTAATDKQ